MGLVVFYLLTADQKFNVAQNEISSAQLHHYMATIIGRGGIVQNKEPSDCKIF